MTEETSSSTDGTSAIEDGKILDYITGKPVAENDKERVRQRIARAFFHEYGISVDDMEPDFKVRVDGSNKKIDIAIFESGSDHKAENVRRLVVCQKEVKLGDKGAYKMRDHEQAAKDLELHKSAMSACENCKYGLWTNGLEFFFFQVEHKRFDVKFNPIGDWPMADESLGTRDVASHAKLRRADPEMLRTAFRRCHNYIHGNEGMPKDAAFWQFLYLIFAKLHDERQPNDARRFWAGRFEQNGQLVDEQFDPAGQKAIRKRIEPLFADVKKKYSTVFRGNEEITLSDRALAFMVSELAKYDFGRTDVDAKGAAYQEIVGTNLRGDRGQYFTPRGAIKLVVSMLDPKPNERVLDPACGTGGFLTATLAHLARKFERESPGRLIIVDLRDEFIEKDEALGLFVVLLQLFADAKYRDVQGVEHTFNKLVVFDEAHKYIESPDLVAGLIEVVREMRHKGTSIMVASQDPPSVPVSLIELSSQIILHKFNSPAWLKHIQKANAALGALTPEKMSNLRPGEAFIWSSKATDDAFTKSAVKIRCRPRVTQHGGATKTAVG
jgi:type I restriction enzyme M protein